MDALGRITYNYLGTRAQEEWEALGCTTSLPIEADGGPGTAGGHFDEVCLGNELMTGFLDTGGSSTSNVLSRISIAAFEDMGYTVSYDAAGAYGLSNVRNSCCLPNGRRHLRTKDDAHGRRNLAPLQEEARDSAKRPLSEALMESAAEEAAKRLQAARDHAPTNIPDGIRYIGDQHIKIFVLDEDGEIQDATFTWEDVEHRMRK